MFSTVSGRIAGTPAYCAPEQILDPSSVDGRADIYSFGLVLFELLTGRRAFEGPDVMHQRLLHDPPAARAVRAGVPMRLDALVTHCLERDRERRCPSFAALESALAGIATDHHVSRVTPVSAIAPPGEAARAALTAQNLMALRRWTEAPDPWKTAIELNRGEPEFHNNLAVCAARMGVLEDAVAAVGQALSIRDGYAEAWANLGGFHAALGEYERGCEACDRAIALNPDHADGHANKGLNLAGLGRFEEASDCLEHSVRTNPRYAPAYVMAADIAARRGAPARELLSLLDRALAIQPDAANALAFKAACLADLGRQDEANEHLELAGRADPSDRLYREIRAAFTRQFRGP